MLSPFIIGAALMFEVRAAVFTLAGRIASADATMAAYGTVMSGAGTVDAGGPMASAVAGHRLPSATYGYASKAKSEALACAHPPGGSGLRMLRASCLTELESWLLKMPSWHGDSAKSR